MNNFTFYSPTLFTFGDGEEKNTGALVRRFGGSRVLLVTGGGSVRRNGAYDAVTAEDVRGLAEEIFDFSRASLSAVGRVRTADEYRALLN